VAVLLPTVVLILFQLEPLFVEYSKAKVKLAGISSIAPCIAALILVLENSTPPKLVGKATVTVKFVFCVKVISCQSLEVVSPLKVLETVCTGVPVALDISVKARSVNPESELKTKPPSLL